MRSLLWLMLLLVSSSSAPIHAVLIETGDGSGNTTAPSPDPGWHHVGTPQGLTAVYLGNGVVLTANHAGPGDLTLDGVVYPFVPGSDVRLENDDGSDADLLLFAVSPAPPLPTLPIAEDTPAPGTPVVMIGRGRNRGAATEWDPNGGSPNDALHGYSWASGVKIRWGTNHVEPYPASRVFGTEVFTTSFDEGSSAHEAQGANGDSGGAVFAWNGTGYELAGILLGITGFQGQPAATSLYTQITYAADLAYYHDQIETTMALPEPARVSAQVVAAALLWTLAATRRRATQSPGRVPAQRRCHAKPSDASPSASSRRGSPRWNQGSSG